MGDSEPTPAQAAADRRDAAMQRQAQLAAADAARAQVQQDRLAEQARMRQAQGAADVAAAASSQQQQHQRDRVTSLHQLQVEIQQQQQALDERSADLEFREEEVAAKLLQEEQMRNDVYAESARIRLEMDARDQAVAERMADVESREQAEMEARAAGVKARREKLAEARAAAEAAFEARAVAEKELDFRYTQLRELEEHVARREVAAARKEGALRQQAALGRLGLSDSVLPAKPAAPAAPSQAASAASFAQARQEYRPPGVRAASRPASASAMPSRAAPPATQAGRVRPQSASRVREVTQQQRAGGTRSARGGSAPTQRQPPPQQTQQQAQQQQADEADEEASEWTEEEARLARGERSARTGEAGQPYDPLFITAAARPTESESAAAEHRMGTMLGLQPPSRHMVPAVHPWQAQTADRQRVMLKHRLDLALSERDTWRAEAHALRELLMMRKQRGGKHRMPALHQSAVEAAEEMARDDARAEEEEHLGGFQAWTLEGWLRCSDLPRVVADALLRHLSVPAFRAADLHRHVRIGEGGAVSVGPTAAQLKPRTVEWRDGGAPTAADAARRIEEVEEKVGGRVKLSDGVVFVNPPAASARGGAMARAFMARLGFAPSGESDDDATHRAERLEVMLHSAGVLTDVADTLTASLGRAADGLSRQRHARLGVAAELERRSGAVAAMEASKRHAQQAVDVARRQAGAAVERARAELAEAQRRDEEARASELATADAKAALAAKLAEAERELQLQQAAANEQVRAAEAEVKHRHEAALAAQQRAGTIDDAEATTLRDFGKFAPFDLLFGRAPLFFGGLAGLVGRPCADRRQAMEEEHCQGADKHVLIHARNYDTTTFAEAEWHFVTDGKKWQSVWGKRGEGVEAEVALRTAVKRVKDPKTGAHTPCAPEEEEEPDLEKRGRCRRQRDISWYYEGDGRRERERWEAKLRAAGVAEAQCAIAQPELIAARLYTGPMFLKYNLVLRGMGDVLDAEHSSALGGWVLGREVAAADADADPRRARPSGQKLEVLDAARKVVGGLRTSSHIKNLEAATKGRCVPGDAGRLRFEGNLYPTTLHTLDVVIRKLARVTEVRPLYRGNGYGAKLPTLFTERDTHGARGGVELGFMSTTADAAVAHEYATDTGVLFEIEQGVVDRGADLAWLSQCGCRCPSCTSAWPATHATLPHEHRYPHEQEVTWPPLTSLSVSPDWSETRVQDAVTIVKVLPTVVQADTKPPEATAKPEPEVIIRHREQTPKKETEKKATPSNFPTDIKAAAPLKGGAMWEDRPFGSRTHLLSAVKPAEPAATTNRGGGLFLFVDEGKESVVERPSSVTRRHEARGARH